MAVCTDLTKAEPGQCVYYRASYDSKLLIHNIDNVYYPVGDLDNPEICLELYFNHSPYQLYFDSNGICVDGRFYEPGISRIYLMTEGNNLIYQAEREYEIDDVL